MRSTRRVGRVGPPPRPSKAKERPLLITDIHLIVALLIVFAAIALVPVSKSLIMPFVDGQASIRPFLGEFGITGAQILGIASIEDLDALIVTGACPLGYATVLRMSNTTNAHAELANQSNYAVRVCVADSSGKNTITAGGGTVFLRLSNVTNAHVEQANYSNYNFSASISASIDTISCQYTQTNGTCQSNQTCLATISAGTNAHVGDCTAYQTTVCCGFTTDVNVPPTLATVVLNSSLGLNTSAENLTAWTINATDLNGDAILNITNWYVNGSSIISLNMPFENHSGIESAIAKEYSAANNTGYVRNGAVYIQSGGFDGRGAYSFDGVNDYIQVFDDASLDVTSELTLEAWINPSSFGTEHMVLAKWADNGLEDRSYLLNIEASGLLTFSISSDGTAGGIESVGSTSALRTGWQHVVGVYGAQNRSLYIDGVLNNSAPVGAGSIHASASNLQIGILNQSGLLFWPFVGSIDQVRIWNTGLTSNQVRALYHNQSDLIDSSMTVRNQVWQACVTPNDGTVDGAEVCSNNLTILNALPSISNIVINSTLATNLTTENVTAIITAAIDADGDVVRNITDWRVDGSSIMLLNMPFEGGSNSSFTKDYSTFSRNGTVANVTLNATAGFDGGGAYLFGGSGSGDGIHVGDWNITDEWTITAWIYPQSYANWNMIVAKWDADTDQRSFTMNLQQGDGDLNICVSDQGVNSHCHQTGFTPALNTWTHVAVSYEGLGYGTMRLYTGGVERPDSIRATGGAEVTGPAFATDTPVYIGRAESFSGGGQFFDGYIDNVMVFNRELSPEQIALLYQNDTGTILARETLLGQSWQMCATPNDGLADGSLVCSSELTIVNQAPTLGALVLNSSLGTNLSAENLTAHALNSTDADAELVKIVYDWQRNGSSFKIFNLPFEGGSNASYTQDYSGFNRHGAVIGADYLPHIGYDGFGAYEFRGPVTSHSIDMGTWSVGDEFTIEAWVYPTAFDNDNQIVSKWDNVNNRRSFSLFLDQTTGDVVVCISDLGNNSHCQSTTYTPSLNAWTHLVTTYNGTGASGVELFAQGVQRSLSTYSTSGAAVTGPVFDTNTTVYIGRAQAINGAAAYFTGRIDEVSMWNTSISHEQIVALYNNRSDLLVSSMTQLGETWAVCAFSTDAVETGGQVCSGNLTIVDVPNSLPTIGQVVINSTFGTNHTGENLTLFTINASDADFEAVKNISDWRVNGSSRAILNMPFEAAPGYQNARDYSSTGVVANISGASFGSTIGYDGFGAYEFDGANDSILLSNQSLFSIGNLDNGFTIMIRSYHDSAASNNTNTHLFSKISGGSGRDEYNMFLRPSNSVLANDGLFSIQNSTAAVANVEIANGTVVYDSWQSWTAVYDPAFGSFGQARLYLGGTLIGATNLSSAPSSNNESFRIGVRHDLTNSFIGEIDNVLFYDAVLSDAQILSLVSTDEIIVSQETSVGEVWQACVTPNDGIEDGAQVCSSNLTIVNALPTISAVIVNSSLGTNTTNENLTLFVVGASDADADHVKNISDWRVNGTSIAVLNMPFEGVSDTTYPNDYSQSANTATVSGASWSSSGGWDGFGAYLFDGVDDVITVTNDASLEFGTGDFSVCAWFNSSDSDGGLVTKRDDIVADYIGWYLRVVSGRVDVALFHDGATYPSNIYQLSSSSLVNDSQWHHACGVFDRDGLGYVYVDGSLENSSSIASFSGSISSGKDLWIGNQESNNNPLAGWIDEVVVFNRTISAGQISAMYSTGLSLLDSSMTSTGQIWQACVTPNDGIEDGATVCSSNLTIVNALPTISAVIVNSSLGTNTTNENLTVFAVNVTDADNDSVKNITDWRVNGTSIAVLNMPFEPHPSSSTVAIDYSSFGNNGTISNLSFGPVLGVDGSGAYVFNGIDSEVVISDSDAFSFGDGASDFPFSISIWFNTSDNSSVLFSKRESASNLEYSLFIDPFNRVSMALYDETSANRIIRRTSPIVFGQWYNLVFTYDGSGQISGMNLFLDGVLDNALNDSAGVYVSMNNTNASVKVGQEATDSLVFEGVIDNIQVFNRELSSDAISLLFSGGLAVMPSDETSVGEVWQACVTPNDGTEDGATVCSNNLTILTALSVPIPISPQNGIANLTDRSPQLIWNNSESAGTTSYQVQVSNSSSFTTLLVNASSITEGTTNTSYNISVVLDTDQTYYWRVRANDSTTTTDWSSTQNFTIVSFLAAGFALSNTSFGVLIPGQQNDTEAGGATPMLVENTGNVPINISVLGTRLFSQGLFPASSFQYRVAVNESNSFDVGASTTWYANVTNVSSTPDIVSLNWTDVMDTAIVHLRIVVPEGEPAGNKTSTVTLAIS